MIPIPESTPSAECSLHDWASLRLELLFIFDQPAPLGSRELAGARNEGELSAWLIRQGRVWIESDGEKLTAKAGEWVICFGHGVRQRFSSDSRILSLRIFHGWPGGLPLFFGSPLQRLNASTYPRLERLAHTLLTLVGKPRVPERSTRLRENFLWQTRLDHATYLRYERTLRTWRDEFIAAMTREGRRVQAPRGVDPRLARALQFIDSLPPDAAFPQTELERLGGLILSRLNRLSCRIYGFTPYAYWERRRVDRARLALEHSGARIKEVAANLGFLQLSHFSAWFKRHTGVSPRTFRERSSGRDTEILVPPE